MKFKRQNGIYSTPIITEEHVNYIKDLYLNKKKSIKYIANDMEVSEKFISKIMEDNNIPKRNNREQALKYSCDENFFEEIDTEEKAYWLGFLYADGYITERKTEKSSLILGISLSVKDIEHLYKFKKSLKSNHNINKYKVVSGYKVGADYCRILIFSNKLCNDLIKQGCVKNKTDILTFPNIKKELKKDFIRGYIDGDGSLVIYKSRNKKNCSIHICGTKEILLGIEDYLEINNKLIRRYKDRTNNNFYITIGGNLQVKRISKLLYGDSTIYLERKYNKFLEIQNI